MFNFKFAVLNVSIHTPTQGVTINNVQLKGVNNGFNPHTHAGCDPNAGRMWVFIRVSIHTPTQGVTSPILCRFRLIWFQSTHPRRV